MFSNQLSTMAQTPSRFGMPMCGSAYGTARDLGTTLSASGTAIVRDRHVTVARTLVKGAFPGTSAWRPPTC